MVNNVKLRVIAEAANKTGLCGAESRWAFLGFRVLGFGFRV